MYVFYVTGTEVKNIMNKLLKEAVFDEFEVRSVEIETFVKYEIKGNLNSDYLKEEEKRFFCFWGELKPYVFQLVKGKIKPKYMKIVLSLREDRVPILAENGKAMFLNLHFENNKVICTTGTSQKNFSLDKNVDIAWEGYIKKFFKKAEIAVSMVE